METESSLKCRSCPYRAGETIQDWSAVAARLDVLEAGLVQLQVRLEEMARCQGILTRSLYASEWWGWRGVAWAGW